MKHYILYALSCLLALTASLPLSAQDPSEVLMPQKLTLIQPHSGKGSFKVIEEGQVANGFALAKATVTLELSPNTTDDYSVSKDLIKVYKTGDPHATIPLNTNIAPYSFTMPNHPVTIEVEFKKPLTIIPDKDQVLYKDEQYTAYKPTYTVNGITEADGDVVFTGNLKIEGDEPYQIVNNDLSAGNKYELKVEPGVTVTPLPGNASDAVAIPDKNTAGQNGWYLGPNNSFTLKAPTGFLIKQATPTTRSLSNATAADEYTDKLVFTDEGERIIHYNLKRIGMDTPPSENKSITYKLDYSLPQYTVTVNERSATVKLADWISGLAEECFYQWDEGPERKISGIQKGDKEATFTLSGNAGSHTLSLKLIDVAGNVLDKTNIPVTLEDTYVPPYVPDDDNDNDSDDPDPKPDPDPDPDPVANETILGSSFGIGIDNGKLSLEASQPCRVFIHTFSGSLQYMKQLPAGTTRLYNLPASRYIITLETPKGVIRRKVMVW